MWVELCARIIHQLAAHHVGKVARHDARRAVGIVAEIVGAIEAECADSGIIGGDTSIGMEGERQIEWHTQTFFLIWNGLRTASQVIHPFATATEIVGVVGKSVRHGVNAVGEAAPLQI